jgi:hypothetical protein
VGKQKWGRLRADWIERYKTKTASKNSKQGQRTKQSMQEEGKKSGADKWWARRCELERRIERRGKMIENADKLLEAIGMSMNEGGRQNT